MLYINGACYSPQLNTIDNYVDTEVADIKAVTDNIPDSGALTSLVYEVEVLEQHAHSGTRWFGSTAGSSPALVTSLTPFSVVASADAETFGTAIEIMDGTEDWDYPIAIAKFDPDKIFVTGVGSNATIWKMRFANSGWNGTAHTYASMAEAVAANKYTEVLLKVDSTKSDASSVLFASGRANYGSKLWCQVMNNAGDNNDDSDEELTISFLIAGHGYSE